MLQTSRRVLLATNTEKYTTFYYYCESKLLVLLGKQGIKFTELNILQFCLMLAGFLQSFSFFVLMGIIYRASSFLSSYNNRFRVMTKAWMKSSFIYLTSDKKKNIEYTQSTLLNLTVQCCSTGTNLRSGVLFFLFFWGSWKKNRLMAGYIGTGSKARYRRRTFPELRLLWIKADPNYLDQVNWLRNRSYFQPH